MSKKLRGKDLLKIGYQQGRQIGIALQVMQKHFKRMSKVDKLDLLCKIIEKPEDYVNHETLESIANELLAVQQKEAEKLLEHRLKEEADRYKIYGEQFIADNAIEQMDMAMRLPVTIAGALMPDAHHGYGLPIGGVFGNG